MAILAIIQINDNVQSGGEVTFELGEYPQSTPEELLTWKEQTHQAAGWATVRQAGGKRVRAVKQYPGQVPAEVVRIFQVK